MRARSLSVAVSILAIMTLVSALPGQQEGAFPQRPQGPPPPQAQVVPTDLKPLLLPARSGMSVVAERYRADRDQLSQFYHCLSPVRFARLKRFDLDWTTALAALDTKRQGSEVRKELSQLQEKVRDNLKQNEADAALAAQVGPLVPFEAPIFRLEEARMRMESMDAQASAVVLSQVIDLIDRSQADLRAALNDPARIASLPPGLDAAVRASDRVKELRTILRHWFDFYNGYDPLFTWWMAQPFHQADMALEQDAAFLRDTLAPAIQRVQAPAPVEITAAPEPSLPEVPDLRPLLAFRPNEMGRIVQRFRGGQGRGFGGMGGPGAATAAPDPKFLSAWLAALKKLPFNSLTRAGQLNYLYMRNLLEVRLRRASAPPRPAPQFKGDASGITGRPIGREGLMSSLAEELIPYTPELLIALAERQFAWCEAEMKKASAEMGLGDDWKAALEKVKETHVPPGRQPDLVRDLMFGAVDYLRAHDLISVPEIESETLLMEMMSPRRQLVNPFFTGGSEISVSYPTDTMTTSQKLQSMRGNNIPFSHATAFHEMIPGHNMEFFMDRRFGNGPGGEFSTAFWIEGWAVYWETLLYDLGFDGTPEERVGALFWRMHRCARIVFSLKFHLGEWSPQQCIDYLVDKVGHERENAAGEVRRSFSGGYGPLYQAAYLVGALQIRELKKEFVDSGRMTLKQFHDAAIVRGGLPLALLRLDLGGGKLARNMPLEWECFGPDPGRGD